MRRTMVAAAVAALFLATFTPLAPAGAVTGVSQRYLVVLDGTQTATGFSATGLAQVRSLLSVSGATVTDDLSSQIGVLMIQTANLTLVDTLRASIFVDEVGSDFSWKAFESPGELAASGATTFDGSGPPGEPAPDPADDPLEALQWDMAQIQADQAHDIQAGIRAVDVGVLDSGIDGNHVDFKDADGVSNVDCARGRNFVTFVPDGGPGVGNPDPCIDNQFHGTHVAGTIGARANGIGIIGVAPNVTLVPVKVCDTTGYCYASAVVNGITYAGDAQLDVINMSFFVDDNAFQESHEFKCMDDPTQRAFRRAVERAIQYARNQGVTPVAALGNSDNDLAHPPEPYENNCEVVPAESAGVIGTSALGRDSEKADYSNYGSGPNDVAAPGGNGTTGDCTTTVPSTFPGGLYICIQGTSMASPHAAGVAALIVSQFGSLGSDGDVKLSPTKVESYLQSSAIDIGLAGYDECFGHGRIDAFRAVTRATSRVTDPSAPPCPEYAE